MAFINHNEFMQRINVYLRKSNMVIICFLILLTGFSIPVFADDNNAKIPDSLSALINRPGAENKYLGYVEIIKYFNKTMPINAHGFSEKAMQIAISERNRKWEADVLFLDALSYHLQSMYNEAMERYLHSLDIRKEIDDKVGIGECLNRIGLIYNVRGEFEKALDYCQKSIAILEKEDNKTALAASYNHLGIIYYILNDISHAESIMQTAIKISEASKDDQVLAFSHEHLAIIDIKKQDYDKATYHVKKTIELRNKINDKVGIAGSYENMAIINRGKKNYPEALKYFQLSYDLKNELKNRRGLSSSIAGIGSIYFEMKEYKKSLEYQLKAYELRRELGDKRAMVSSLNRLAETYSAMDDYKSAFDYYKLAKIYNDSLLNEKKNKAIAEYQETFQREKRDKEIDRLQQENTIQRNMRNSLFVISILLASIIVIVFFEYRSKRKVNALLLSHNKEILNQKEELQNLNEQLKELIATKDKFFSIIAHDLSSPFQGFLGLTEIIADQAGTLSAAELSKLGSNMNKTANNLFALLRNLLEWAQMQRGTFSFEPSLIALNDIIEDNIETIKKRSEQKGIQIVNEVKSRVTVFADAKMVNSILLNLLSNSLKFTGRNGIITVNAEENQQMITVSVKDSGVGIAANKIDKLFIVGEKIGTKGTEGEMSTGLGLLLCKEFVEKHGGRIWVESSVGQGSVFYFTLPVYADKN